MIERSIKNYSHVAWLIVIGMTILFVDFFSKAYIYYLFPIDPGFSVFQNVLGIDFFIHLMMNKGAAWGIFADFQNLLLIVRILVVIGMLIYLFFINQKNLAKFPLVLIISGAMGNIIDFFLYGFVVDFLHFNLWGYHFPVFNIADASITIGVFWLFIIASISRKDPSYKLNQ